MRELDIQSRRGVKNIVIEMVGRGSSIGIRGVPVIVCAPYLRYSGDRLSWVNNGFEE